MRLTALIILISFLLIQTQNHGVLADPIFGGRPGGGLGRGSREMKYKIEFHPEDSPFYPDEDLESVILPNKEGQKFRCYLPKMVKPKSVMPMPQHNSSSMIMETEKRLSLKTPDELLDGLKDICLLRQEGWWTYEFCFKKALRQLHLEDEKEVVQEYVLGVFDAEATANQSGSDVSTFSDPQSNDATQRHHTHIYTNGTTCDLTNEPRQTEVRFVCSEPKAMISSVTELSTCKYAITVQCPLLCKHPLFQEELQVWQTVNCNALPKDHSDKESNKETSRDKDEQIAMVTGKIEYLPPKFESEERAT
ncbi:unnamed protein product [Rhodiola kirilowii]